jgi:DNA-binding NtrC family response regulator
MPDRPAKILIVDDYEPVRRLISHTLAEIGYGVRCAGDGFSALHEIHQETPDILLSDLNMPGISGLELLSEVRRCFPSIQTIAMSGSFSGNEVPSGVAADAFYEKGSSMGALLQIIARLSRMERRNAEQLSIKAPILVHRTLRDSPGRFSTAIVSPQRLRSFSRKDGTGIKPSQSLASLSD